MYPEEVVLEGAVPFQQARWFVFADRGDRSRECLLLLAKVFCGSSTGFESHAWPGLFADGCRRCGQCVGRLGYVA